VVPGGVGGHVEETILGTVGLAGGRCRTDRAGKLRLSDVKELFAQMKDHTTFAGSRRGH